MRQRLLSGYNIANGNRRGLSCMQVADKLPCGISGGDGLTKSVIGYAYHLSKGYVVQAS